MQTAKVLLPGEPRSRAPRRAPPELDRPFQLLVLDWDGTAVASRQEDPAALRAVLARLLRQNVAIVAVTGTHKGHLERQLADRIQGPHKRNLYLATNRGSEAYGFDEAGQAVLLWRREATAVEDRSLSAAAEAVRRELNRRTDLEFGIVSDRLNRRKVDLIPLPEWADPPKSAMRALFDAVERRLTGAGLPGGLAEAVDVAVRLSALHGPEGARVTSDVKHVEIGLTDKGDAMRWLLAHVAAPRGIEASEILVAGDEFGPVAGLSGSDGLMRLPEAADAVFVSVGAEPAGVPAGVLHLGGGPTRFRDLVASIAERTVMPVGPFPDPHWLVVEEGFNLAREHEIESLMALSNGYLGTRASLAEGSRLSEPASYLAGIFEKGGPEDAPRLLRAPDLFGLRLGARGTESRPEAGQDRGAEPEGSPGDIRRVLDLREGMLWQTWRHRDAAGRISLIREFRLASRADPHVMFQALSFRPENYSGEVRLEAAPAGPDRQSGVLTRRTPDGGVVAFAVSSRLEGPDGQTIVPEAASGAPGPEAWRFDACIDRTCRLFRTIVACTSRDAEDPVAAAKRRLERVVDAGVAALVADHRTAWLDRWRAADATIAGDPPAQRALRFAGYHLSGAANPGDPGVSVGARGLTGPAYKGHYFWDTEVHLLPYYSLTWPEAARALLMFRHRTLEGARRKARDLGFRGALYPWEATATGEEATPPFALAPDEVVVRIATRDQAHHISAAVAHAAWTYWHFTGDDAFMWEAGAEILVETARFWASRCQPGGDGRLHIRQVVGPDEYHPGVDDDAYTNEMARWNLETAARLAVEEPVRWRTLAESLAIAPGEPGEWEAAAAALHSGLDRRTGLFEQFRGYFDLPDVEVPPFEDRSAPPDVLLGREVVASSRLIKQADVLLLFLLLPERFADDVQEANYRFYMPRCGHGSSLSPGVHAAVAARLGHMDDALAFFRQAADVDLSNNMGNAAGGVHMATLGSLWQALVLGFGGFRPDRGKPNFQPRLPPEWREVRIPLVWRGRPVEATL